MSEYSWHFGGPVGAIPQYNQEDDAAIFRLIFSDGVFSGLLNELEVVENDPVALAVGIKSGWAFNYGRFYNNTSLLTKTLAAADPDNPRIDRIVLRLDTTETFKISAEVLTGTPAADPDPPELTQTAAIYEIPLYQVLVGAGVTSVSNANLTDERTYAAVSGLDLYATLVGIETLTNKRNTKRAYTTTSLATLTPEIATYDMFSLTAQAEALNIANHATSTPTAGECIFIDILPDATPRALTYGTNYVAKSGVALPSTTVASKRLQMLFIWLADISKYTLAWAGPEA